MKTIRNIYKIGFGPSSSHSMGPRRAAEMFRARLGQAPSVVNVKLFGSLAAFALAVSEENAAGGQIVTAPTCGSCPCIPA